MPKHLSRLTAQDQVLTANDLFDPENRPHGKVMALAETKSLVDHSTQAHIFATKAELDAFVAEQSALSEAERTVKVGDNLYITDTGVPDYWWMGEAPWISELETGAVKVNVDTSLDNTSVNPVANSAVTGGLNALGATVAGLEESKMDAQMVSSVGDNTGVDASDESQTANLPDYDNITWGIGTLASYGCTGSRVKPKKVTLFRKANATANSEGSLWFRILRYKDGAWYVAYRANVYVTHGSYTRKGQPIVHTMEYVAGSEFIPANERVVFCYANAKDGDATNIHNFGAKVVNVSPDAGVTTNTSSLPSSPSATGSATYELAAAIEYDKYVSIDEILTTCSNVAIGSDVSAAAGCGVVIGPLACGGGYGAVAVGYCSVVSYGDSVAVGASASAADYSVVAVGAYAKALKHCAVAVGNGARVDSTGGIAIGLSSRAESRDAVAIGFSVAATDDKPIVIGGTNLACTAQITVSKDGVLRVGGKEVGSGCGGSSLDGATATNYTQFGSGAEVTCSYGVAVGGYACAGYSSVAIGDYATTSVDCAVAIGACSAVCGCVGYPYGAVAVGAGATADGDTPIVIGGSRGSDTFQITVSKDGTLKVGGKAVGGGSVFDASTTDIKIGKDAFTCGNGYCGGYSIAIGTYARANNSGVSIGSNTQAEDLGVAVGYSARAADGGVAYGYAAMAVSQDSVAVGYMVTTSDDYPVVIGHRNRESAILKVRCDGALFVGNTEISPGAETMSDLIARVEVLETKLAAVGA